MTRVSAGIECFGKEAGALETEWMGLAALGPLQGVAGTSLSFVKDRDRSRRGILGTPFVSAEVAIQGPEDLDAGVLRKAMDISLRGLAVFAADRDRGQALRWEIRED